MPRAVVVLLILLWAPALFAGECVVLLHGLARTSSSMRPMQRALEEAGFLTFNVEYPSRDFPVETLAQMAVPDGLEGCRQQDGADRIHFVTHSLGGILLRQYLSTGRIEDLGRVVMMAPPNQGSEAADDMGAVPGFDWLNGPAGRQLGKGEDSVPLRLGPADFELGVIAGTRSIDPITSAVLEDPDDGRVSVADTRLEGMDDFITIEHSHAFMMRMPRTVELTIVFLRTGRFSQSPDAAR